MGVILTILYVACIVLPLIIAITAFLEGDSGWSLVFLCISLLIGGFGIVVIANYNSKTTKESTTMYYKVRELEMNTISVIPSKCDSCYEVGDTVWLDIQKAELHPNGDVIGVITKIIKQ